MQNFRTSLFRCGLLLAVFLLIPMLAGAQSSTSFDRIVALVEDDVILKSELDEAIGMIERQARSRGERMPPRSVIEEQVLERLVMTRLEVLRAEATGIRVSDTDVDQALEQVARQNGLNMSQLRAAIESDGIDFREFRRDVREELMTTRFRQRVVNAMDEITETEVDILLASNRLGGDEYLISQIVISVPEAASQAEVNEARRRAEDVRARLDDGLEFSTAALTFSQAPDALEGGNVGWRPINAMAPQFAEAVRSAPLGGYSDVLRTPAGFMIIHVRDRRDQSEIIVREFRARHLMVEPSELVTPQQARDRIFELHQRIQAGESFADLARQYSTDETTANIGGLLNWFRPGEYGQFFQEVVESLEPGELSDPVQTAQGWHLLRLEDVREADRTVEMMRAEARDMLFQQKADEEIERFLRQMRAESFVEIRL
ncbi:MAG: peptidylprolyl isomerase [Wenzhouxiangella sp.]|nr:peptidylprolyl isomerase [Wenzhouxiangella sp.]MCH8478108.1 peptidylprolyl isomerase [Wenzhouxiangella sp.]TVR94112.1 MAG: molecular chaperone SurA [Wenzhouxiangellaceae bacterium]